MRYRFDQVVIALALLPSTGLAQQSPPVETVLPLPKPTLEMPVLRFEVEDIPGEGRVASVVGRVERMTRTGWVDVMPGDIIGHDLRLQIPANSDLVVRFASGESRKYTPAATVRRVAFRVVAPR